MATLKLFDQFAKGKVAEVSRNKNCVIYTRVSTKEQAENNMSLDIQRRACEQFAKKNEYIIMAYFGGTYESAKTDERKEFNNMLAFVKRSREKISYIIVYSIDRFSRSGANAIYITDQLQKQNISVLSVTQPTDASTPSGILQQNIQFIFSQYDNQLRREKTIAGMKNKLLMGEWCTAPPVGYDIVRINGKKSIVANKDGELIRKAFLWKYYENISEVEIVERLQSMGFKILKQKINKVLKNPFYCGIIVNKLLEGKVVNGKHEKIISKEIFLAINNSFISRKEGIYHSKDNPSFPLKHILFCPGCGKKFSGYITKNHPYYKCRESCKVNIKLETVNNLFLALLKKIKIDVEKYPSLKKDFTSNFIHLEEVNRKDLTRYKRNITLVNNNIDLIEKRFALGEIPESIYKRQLFKMNNELNDTEILIDKTRAGIISAKDVKERENDIIANIPDVWEKGELSTKKIIQSTIFPEGLFFYKSENKIIPKSLGKGFILAEESLS